MTVHELKRLASGGESQYLEFKQYATVLSQITEEIVGFLNASGGKLLVGVKDDGLVTGLKYPEDDLSYIEESSLKSIKPIAEFSTEIVPVSGKKAVIVLHVPEGDEKPYAVFNSESKHKSVFIRVNDECIKASRELRSILKMKNRPTGQTIVYSDIEAAVLKLIDERGAMTKAEIVKHSDYNSRTVSDCLIRLVTSKVLSIQPANSGDLFEYNHPA